MGRRNMDKKQITDQMQFINLCGKKGRCSGFTPSNKTDNKAPSAKISGIVGGEKSDITSYLAKKEEILTL